ncbi:hypothetical protein IBQ20_001399 [Enterococcus hirae]|nr:hypothetical protein [Enterococcus hirae]
MSVYEAIQLMLAFATFVLLLIDKKDQKNNHLNHFWQSF